MASIRTIEPQSLAPIVYEAWEASSLVQYAFTESYLYNHAVYYEQSFLLDFNANYVSTDLDFNQMQSTVLARIDQDLAVLGILNDAIAYTQFYTNETLTYSLKTNKMTEALEGARDLIADPTSFAAILSGEFPPGFEQAPPNVVMIADPSSPFGNSNNTYLSTAIVETAMSLIGPDASIMDLNDALGGDWIDHSAISHITPMNPHVFDQNPSLMPAYFGNFSFCFSDTTTPLGFSFIHSGYAFGGFREEDRYSDGKLFGPEDCSSWIAKLCNCPEEISTIDLLFTYRALTPNNFDYVDNEWLNSQTAEWMTEAFTPVQINNPFTDIHAGQILAFRHFASEDHSLNAGYAGHVALVLGVTDEGEVVTLNYTRDMPQIEGFGISLFDYKSSDAYEVFFLEPKQNPLSLSDIFSVHDSDIAFWQETGFALAEIDTQAMVMPLVYAEEPSLVLYEFG